MKYLLSLISILYCSCMVAQISKQINVYVEQIDSDQQIVLKYDTAKNYVWAVSFPFEYELKDQTPSGTWFRRIGFYYAAEFLGFPSTEAGWTGAIHEMKFDGKYQMRPDPTDLNGQKYPYPSYHLIRTHHLIQKSSDIQDSLVQYIQEILKNKDYKLPIGTLEKFKAKHPQLIDRFLRGDSVRFVGYNKQTKLYEWINLPIEY